MPSRSKADIAKPGYNATGALPGVAAKLRRQAASGFGEIDAVQRHVAQFERTQPEGTRPEPHVMDIHDVTKMLGLDAADEQRIQKLVMEPRVDFGSSVKNRSPRLAYGRGYLLSALREMKQLSTDQRMEITRRALAFWRKTQPVDDARRPTIRATQKSMLPRTHDGLIPDLLRVEELKLLSKAMPPPTGQAVQLHPEVVAQIGNNDDPEYHRAEHAKHAQAWAQHAQTDPEKAAAHKQAAIIHRNVGNQILQSKQNARNVTMPQPPQKKPQQPGQKPPAAGGGPPGAGKPPAGAQQPPGAPGAAKPGAGAPGQPPRPGMAPGGAPAQGGAPPRPMGGMMAPQQPASPAPGGRPQPGAQQQPMDPNAQGLGGRPRAVPMSAEVGQLKDALTHAVSLMADLSASHDHISQLKAQLDQVKTSALPDRHKQRMIVQLEAEMASAKHEVMQLEDAHDDMMKQIQQQMVVSGSKGLATNPIFAKFMEAMSSIGSFTDKPEGEHMDGGEGHGDGMDDPPDGDEDLSGFDKKLDFKSPVGDGEGEEGDDEDPPDGLKGGADDEKPSPKLKGAKNPLASKVGGSGDDAPPSDKGKNPFAKKSKMEKALLAMGLTTPELIRESRGRRMVKSDTWLRALRLGYRSIVALDDQQRALRKSEPQPTLVIRRRHRFEVMPYSIIGSRED